jgi:hypothetical protein
MQEPYITPSIIEEKGIKFLKESDLPLELGDSSLIKRNYPKLNQPSFTVDKFAKKTKEQEQIITITLEDLKKLDFVLTTKKAGKNAWLSNQRVIYSIERKTERNPYSQRLSYIPNDHIIQKDINNNRVRIFGSNAGKAGAGNWMEIKK